jgi:dUTP pyrophosphatase
MSELEVSIMRIDPERDDQMLIKRVERVTWNLVNELDETERGKGGFGSTGRL